MNVIKGGVQIVTPKAPPKPKVKSKIWGTKFLPLALVNYVDEKTMKKINYYLEHPPKGTPSLSKILKQIEKEQKKKLYTEQEVREIIGSFADEGNGWDIHFTGVGGCCPGDDNAEVANLIKLLQLKRAGLKVDKKQFEEQSGSYLKYTEQHLKKYLKKAGLFQKSP